MPREQVHTTDDASSLTYTRFDKRIMLVAGIAFVLMATSTLLPWVNVLGEGVVGLQTTTGKITLSASTAAVAWMIHRALRNVGPSQVARVPAALGAMIAVWLCIFAARVSTIYSIPAIPDNPFAQVLAGKVRAGVGLYVGIGAAILSVCAIALLHTPELKKFNMPTQARPLWIAILIGIVAGAVGAFV